MPVTQASYLIQPWRLPKERVPVAGATALEGGITTNMAVEAPMVSAQAIDYPAREVAEWVESYGVPSNSTARRLFYVRQ